MPNRSRKRRKKHLCILQRFHHNVFRRFFPTRMVRQSIWLQWEMGYGWLLVNHKNAKAQQRQKDCEQPRIVSARSVFGFKNRHESVLITVYDFQFSFRIFVFTQNKYSCASHMLFHDLHFVRSFFFWWGAAHRLRNFNCVGLHISFCVHLAPFGRQFYWCSLNVNFPLSVSRQGMWRLLFLAHCILLIIKHWNENVIFFSEILRFTLFSSHAISICIHFYPKLAHDT